MAAVLDRPVSPVPRRMSREEYFAFDAADPDHKYEFWDGLVVMMPGGTVSHSGVKVNVVGEARQRLKGGDCRVGDSDLCVEASAVGRGKYVYPDATIYCGGGQFVEADRPPGMQLTLRDPVVVFEVMSEGSVEHDVFRKLGAYAAIPSLRAYVLLEQRRPEGTLVERQESGHWKIVPIRGLDAAVPLPSVGIELPMAELYDGVALVADDVDDDSASDDSSD